MSISKFIANFLLFSLLLGLVAACAPAESPGEPEILADCFQTATAGAWLDENGDGVWDDGEPPLAGIEFVLEPSVYSRTTTDENGVANILATTPGEACPKGQRIAAVGYAGYQLTTPATVEVDASVVEVTFGFQAEEAHAPAVESDPPSDLFVTTEEGLAFGMASEVTVVNYLFTWKGEAPPIFEYEQIEVENGRYHHAAKGDVTSQIEQLLASLTGLTPVSDVQYTNQWTDDYPEWHIEIGLADGRALLVFAESTGFRGHAPWYILAEGQLYRQTSGDLGFAMFDLVSEKAQPYFSLEQGAFDETLLDPGARTNIYYSLPKTFSGLLPIAPTLNYELDRTAQTLSGTFYTRLSLQREYDSSSRPLTAVGQMQIGAPGGEMASCTLESTEGEYGIVSWAFTCPLPDVELDRLRLSLEFVTGDGGELTSIGQITDIADPNPE